jgi:MFS family permease
MIAFAWSVMFIGMNMYMMERTNESNRGRAFGFLQASFMTATAAGPFLGGPLSDAFGIHTMIYTMSGLMALSLLVLWRLRFLEKRSDSIVLAQDTPQASAKIGAQTATPGESASPTGQ